MKTILWLSNGSNIIRLLKVIIGIGLVVYAFFISRPEYGMLGGILLLQGILNTCCGSGGCAVSAPDKTKDKTEITYEEVK